MIKSPYSPDIINNKLCVCKNKLSKKINFGNLPLINNYTNKINLKKYPVAVSQCEKCKLINLKYSIPDKLLFPSNYSYLSGNSKEKIENFKSILYKIEKFSKKKDPRILDIGSNDGSFLELAKNKYQKVLGIEPTNCANIAINKGINTIKSPLNLKLAKKIVNKYSKFDFIIGTNVLPLTNNTEGILKSIKLLLDKKGLSIIEVQYLYDLISQGGFDSFHHEHTSYFTLSSIIKVMEKYNLYVFDAEKLSVHGGILRVYVSSNKKKLSKRLEKILNKENDKKIFNKLKKLNQFRKKFNYKIKKLLVNLKKKKKKIYGIGAAPRACVLLNSCNITNRQVDLVGEVSQSMKCNKYIPGTNIIVKDENKIITDKPDYVIILAWHLVKRITTLLTEKGYKGSFIVPLPNLRIFKGKKIS